MTPAVGYLRVSSIGQIDGDGLTRQRDAITRYAAANDFEVLDWYSDEGVSGTTELENRPGLAACLERIENNGVKTVLVESSDRLARDAMVSEIIIREFKKSGGTVLTASGVNLTEGGDSNPTAALIRGVLALIAEFDRRVIVLKLRAARDRKKAKEGRCEGVKSYGMLPGEAVVLDSMIQWHIAGMSPEYIAAILNANGTKTRSGGAWRGSVVRKILKRESSRTNVPAQVA